MVPPPTLLLLRRRVEVEVVVEAALSVRGCWLPPRRLRRRRGRTSGSAPLPLRNGTRKTFL